MDATCANARRYVRVDGMMKCVVQVFYAFGGGGSGPVIRELGITLMSANECAASNSIARVAVVLTCTVGFEQVAIIWQGPGSSHGGVDSGAVSGLWTSTCWCVVAGISCPGIDIALMSMPPWSPMSMTSCALMSIVACAS